MKRCAWMIMGGLLLVSTAPFADAETFTLDSSVSFLTADPSYVDALLVEQSPGSLTAFLQGTLQVLLAPGSIEFSGGNVDFIAQLGPFNPGAAPADFAARNLFINATLRDGAFGVTGAARAVVANSFESSSLAAFSAGVIDVATIAGPASENLNGHAFGSAPAALGSITSIGSLLELHLPVDGTLVLGDVKIHFTGQIVATAAVPEPTSGVLATIASCGAALCFAWKRKMKRVR